MPDAAAVHRTSFDAQLPTLAGLHTPAEDRAYFLGLFDACDSWGAFEGGSLIGILILRGDWIEQLYVLPAHQELGVGQQLLKIAMDGREKLFLWTFAQNLRAQTFYERNGFVGGDVTDGSENEERAPAIRYEWTLS